MCKEVKKMYLTFSEMNQTLLISLLITRREVGDCNLLSFKSMILDLSRKEKLRKMKSLEDHF
jgi:hypothetical protein